MTNTKDIKFDIERSLKESPPNYPEGVTWVKRIVVARLNIDWGVKFQPKAGIYDQVNVGKIRGSYSEHGFLYNEPVQIVTPSTTSAKEFEGIGGFQRNEAQNGLGWKYTIVDVVKFASSLTRRIFSFQTNHIFAPRAGNTKVDIVYGVKEAIKANELDSTDDNAIKSFINSAAADFSKAERESIFTNVRKSYGKFANLKPLDGTLANALARELGLQFAGVKNKDVSGIAYVKEHGDSKTLYYDGLKMSNKYDGADITVYGYIANPTPTTLTGDREAWLKKFNDLVDFHYQIVSRGSDEDIATIRISGWCPFKFGGFLPQDITPIGSNNEPKESGLVDKNGRSMDAPKLKVVSAE